MATVIPYLNLGGQCEAAMKLYQQAFGGRVVQLMRMGESPQPCQPEHKHLVMHCEFVADGIRLMASDGMPGAPRPPSSLITVLNATFDSPAEQDRAWAALAEGATVRMPLHQAFWGSRFGMLTDKFGIEWMFNCEAKQS